ncbi:MAG: hypothetical protein MUE85_10395 [Microscillaceae bacterium]|jgi:phosphoribosylformylglycinamidine (FGAM) synthase PurS component|nr:hypothetical protein [Microscillaceae bacterium]
MKNKESKAQLEVWEWKEKAYEQVKHLPVGKRITFILEQTKATVEQIKQKKAEKLKQI